MRSIAIHWKRWLAALAVGALLVAIPLVAVAAGGGSPAPATGTGTPDTSGAICTGQGGQRLSGVLSDLVNHGLISQDQQAKIQDYLSGKAQTACVGAHLLPRVDILHTTANLTGLTASQVRTQLARGDSLAQIASAHGSSADALKAALTKTAQDNAAALVSAQQITQEQADAALSALSSHLDTIVNTEGPPHRGTRGWIHRHFGGPHV